MTGSGKSREQGIMYMRVRVLHAACFAGTLKVLIGSREMACGISYGQLSPYGKVSAGFRRVSVISEETGEELLSETMPFHGGRQMTLVLCNTMNCMMLVAMEECSCGERRQRGCVRAANFSCGEGPFDVMSASREKVFSYLTQGRVAPFLPAMPGIYDFCLKEAEAVCEKEKELGINLKVAPGVSYTICVFGSGGSEQPLEVKILEF